MKLALIPAFNEEKTIGEVVKECLRFVDMVIVCDDGSEDATASMALQNGAHVIGIFHSGKGEALRTLFHRALVIHPDMAGLGVVTIDADGQHNPRDIPKLLKKIEEDGYDMVIGGRKAEDIPTVRALGNKVLSNFNVFDIQSGFRAYRGSVLPKLIPSEMGMAVDTEIFREAVKQGLRIGQVDVSVRYDVPSPSTHNLVYHGLDVLFTDFKLATFRHPMLLYGVPGVALLLVASYFAYGDLPELMTHGFGSVILLLMGFFFLSTALIIWSVVSLSRRLER